MLKASNRQNIEKYHVYADQEHQIGKWQINYGLEYQHAKDHSQQSYTFPQMAGFDDVLREDVADAYVGLQGSLNGVSLSMHPQKGSTSTMTINITGILCLSWQQHTIRLQKVFSN